MRNYKNIIAWEKADKLTIEIYRETRNFLKEEIYGLTSQLRRSAYSVSANIAEEAARETDADFLKFLTIARGSLTETEYFLHLAYKLEYLPENKYKELTSLVNETFSTLHGLIKSIKTNS